MNDFGSTTEQGTVRLERLLPGPIERVWAYLTESDKRATWFAAGVFELRVGGKADLHFDPANLSAEMLSWSKCRSALPPTRSSKVPAANQVARLSDSVR